MGELKTKGLRIATRCTSIDQFVAAFHRFCDAQTVFISTLSARTVGLETPFSIELADHTPALRGIGVVVESWPTPKNPFGRPGLQLGIRRLTADSEKVFEKLLKAHEAVVKPPPSQLAAVVVRAQTPRPFVQTEQSPVVAPPPPPAQVAATLPVAPPVRTLITPPMGSPIARPLAMPPSMPASSPMSTPPAGTAKLSPTALLNPSTLPRVVPQIPKVTRATPPGASPVVAPPEIKPEPKPVVGGAGGEVPQVFESDTGVFNAAIAAATGQFGGTTPAPISEADAPRTPGSELVLPANPLMNLTDDSLEGFVDCTLYEETGNFFPAPEDTFPVGASDDDPIGPPASATIPPFDNREATQSRGGPPRREATAALLAIAAPLEMPVPPHVTSSPDPIERPVTETATDAHPLGEATIEARALAADYRPLASASELQAFAPDSRTVSGDRPYSELEYTTSGAPAYEPPAEIRSYPPEPLYPDAPRRSRLLAGKRRWWVVGGAGVATATIAIALIVTMRSGSNEAHANAVAATDLVAQNAAVNSPPLPGEHARLSKPVTDAKPGEDEASAGDTGAAPVIGAGPCKVAVSTTPAGSIITVDGEQVGPSPITVGGPCAKRKIDVAHPRYQTTTRYVTPKSDAVETLEVTLARPTHDLYVDTRPPGATVSIDGHRAGTSPTLVKIMGFTTLTLTIEKPGFKPETKKLYSKTTRDYATFKLAPNRTGSLTDMLKQ